MSIQGVLIFVDRRLEAILRAPDMWGPPQAVELQALLLVETRLTTLGLSSDTVDLVNERFTRFVGERFPDRSVSLAEALGLKNRATPQFTQLLREFVNGERRYSLVANPYRTGWFRYNDHHFAEA